ncbi:MAG: hypothetical protein R2764_01415 [Bacteroidales bacterium]
MHELKDMQIDSFPYKEGDRVKVRWSVPNNLVEFGKITKLHVGIQWEMRVVYIMVLIDGTDKPQCVSYDIISKA